MPQEFPGLFGGYARSQILFSLVVDGPRTRRGLARQLGIDPTFTLQNLRSLEGAGLVVRFNGPSALNWQNPIAAPVARVIARYVGREVTIGPLAQGSNLPEGYLKTFGTVTRTKLLLATSRLGATTIAKLAEETGLTIDALRTAANKLQIAGVLEIRRSVTHRKIVLLNREQVGYAEVLALLTALDHLMLPA